MAGTNINRVVMTGNLTADPELRSTSGGTRDLQAADRVQHAGARTTQTGEWEDKPNFFDVTVWGAQGENCASYLNKGRPVAIDGRLEWREWTRQDGQKRQSVDIIADSVQFLGGRDDARQRQRVLQQRPQRRRATFRSTPATSRPPRWPRSRRRRHSVLRRLQRPVGEPSGKAT